MRNYSLDTHTSGAFDVLGRETRDHARERKVLTNFAFRVGRAVATAKPRLVKSTEPRQLAVLSLADFLAAGLKPETDVRLVTLQSSAVMSFDKSAVVGASL